MSKKNIGSVQARSDDSSKVRNIGAVQTIPDPAAPSTGHAGPLVNRIPLASKVGGALVS